MKSFLFALICCVFCKMQNVQEFQLKQCFSACIQEVFGNHKTALMLPVKYLNIQ